QAEAELEPEPEPELEPETERAAELELETESDISLEDSDFTVHGLDLDAEADSSDEFEAAEEIETLDLEPLDLEPGLAADFESAAESEMEVLELEEPELEELVPESPEPELPEEAELEIEPEAEAELFELQVEADDEELDLDSLLGAPEDEENEDSLFDSLPEIELPSAGQTAHQVETPQTVDEVLSKPAQPAINPPAALDSAISILPPGEDEEQLDDELQEIFIEEAEEVLETINEYFPKWKQDTADKNSLTEIRRAFHTLKGSGRMVKALVVGELAWSIENLLTRVIEGTVEPNADVLNVIEQVTALSPELVQEYADKQQ